MTEIALILVAAGAGTRAQSDIPKQYKLLGNKPLLQHTLDNASRTQKFAKTVLVVAQDDPRAEHLKLDEQVKLVVGGDSRTASVRAGLESLRTAPPDIVMIHDGARPFLTAAIVSDLIDAVADYDGAVPALPIVDALKTEDFNAVNRDTLRRVQTPQAFQYGAIMAAFDALPANASAHDDISVAAQASLSLTFTTGDERNFKVTYPEDFAKAEDMISPPPSAPMISITGSGYDVHRLAKSDEPLWMCGVPIDCGMTLVGHSDADVGLHAITDAILGAVAQGDIGDHFPPSDPKWAGASSDQFLLHALQLAQNSGAALRHVDLTIICERPKIKPHRVVMRARIAEITGLPLSRVSLKATTSEGLGFTGRGEGITAQAFATLTVPIEESP